jgi:hypothetical protein
MAKRKNWVIYGRSNDCLTACISRLLDIHYDEVPFYGKDSCAAGWLAKLKKWANKKGYAMNLVWRDDINIKELPDKMIGVGASPSGRPNDHAVLVDNNLKVVWDPAYNKRRSIKSVGYVLIFKELK